MGREGEGRREGDGGGRNHGSKGIGKGLAVWIKKKVKKYIFKKCIYMHSNIQSN